VAVVRVEIRDVDNVELLIELLEVGREPGGDTLIGRATNATAACDILGHWLAALFHGVRNPTDDQFPTRRY
jgi:hypothetical protein